MQSLVIGVPLSCACVKSFSALAGHLQELAGIFISPFPCSLSAYNGLLIYFSETLMFLFGLDLLGRVLLVMLRNLMCFVHARRVNCQVSEQEAISLRSFIRNS